MTAKVLEGAGGKIAEQWFPSLLSSPLLFWVGGLLATLQHIKWQPLLKQFSEQPEPIQLAFLILFLSGAIASAFIIERLEFATLRGLEGYWHPIFNRLRNKLIRRQQKNYERLDKQFQELINKNSRSSAENHQLSVTIAQLEALPLECSDLMPTRLGNVLRAYERKPAEKYGLDAIVCWSRLWLLLPDSVKADLNTARAELNAAVRLWIWSVLFIVWTGWAWWALPVSVLSTWVAYEWAVSAAQTYGILIDATFDTHRHLLYQALRIDLPACNVQERTKGTLITNYLQNSDTVGTIEFSTDSSTKGD